VIVTQAATSSPGFKALLKHQWEDLRALYMRLRDIELYESLAQPGPPIDETDPPARLTSRYVVEFVLRSIEAIVGGFGDPVGALVLMEVINVNTSVLPDTEGGDPREGPEGQVPDSLRLPARPRALSQRLGVAYETIRRHLSELERRNLCRREADGYVVPGAVLVQPPLLDHVDRNHALLTRLFTSLAEHGVLAHWEAGRSGGSPGSAIRA